jgi:hypothetical protein
VKRLWGVLLFLLLPIFLHAPQSIYITKGNIFDGVFTEPTETVYFIFFNGDLISFSTHDAYCINLSAYWYKTYLESQGREMREVAIMMHNHFGYPKLSEGDRNILLMFRNYGFKGSFCVWETSNNMKICEPPWLQRIQ